MRWKDKMSRIESLYKNRMVRAAVIFVLAAAAALSLYQGIGNALKFSQDFQWDAAKALVSGMDPYEISMHPEKAEESPDLAEFYAMFTDRGLKQKMEANQFPSLLLLLAPMTVLSAQSAKVAWCIFNLIFTAGIIWLLKKTFFEDTPGFEFAAAVLITIAGTPYRNQLGVGQHTLFAFFFFMLAVWIDMSGPCGRQEDAAPAESFPGRGVLTALALFVSFFKYTLTGPLALYFLYRKRYAPLALAVAGHVAVTAVCAARFGKGFIYMIKAPLEVASRLTAEGGIDLGVLLGGYAGYAVAFVIVILLIYIILRRGPGHEKDVLAMLILWSLVLTYHRTYDFFVLSAAAMMFCGIRDEDREAGRPVIIWYGVLIVLVYFVLRIFDENTPSKICVGIVYYAFTAFVTYALMRRQNPCTVTVGAGKKHNERR